MCPIQARQRALHRTTVRALLLDADAFRFLRSLDLLPVLADLAARTPINITEYVARHELAPIAVDVSRLESAGALTVQRLEKGTPEQIRYREYQRAARAGRFDRRVDKGECEAIAWAMERSAAHRPVFVTCDAGARWLALHEGVRTTDVLGVGVLAVREGVLARERLADHLSPWDSPAQQVGRPAGYASFEAAFQRRFVEEAPLFLSPQP